MRMRVEFCSAKMNDNLSMIICDNLECSCENCSCDPCQCNPKNPCGCDGRKPVLWRRIINMIRYGQMGRTRKRLKHE